MTMTGAGPPAEFSRESWTGERRVTVDLDDCRPFDVVRAVYHLRHAGATEVESRVSASGNGAHVRAWFDDDDVTADAVESLRRSAGDHAKRTEMDRQHKAKPQQVLFTSKGDRQAGEWRADPWLVADELIRRSDELQQEEYDKWTVTTPSN